MIKLEEAHSVVRATVANALAKALICGINECEENGRPLTEVQMIDMAKYSIMNYVEATEALFLEQFDLAKYKRGGDSELQRN